MTHSSSSTVPGASDAPSQDGNGPLSLDALFSAEISGGEQTGPAKNDEESGVAAPHHRDGTASSPEDFATPASSDSPEDPEDVDHEEEADDVDRDLPEADPEDGIDDSDEDDGVDIDEDEVDGHTPFIDTDADSDSHQRDVERAASPRDRDKSEVRTAHEDEEITFADLGLPGDLLKAVTDMGFVTPTAIQKEAIPVLLAGRDVVGVAQTGTGKTAAFGLPLLDAVDSRDNVVQALVLAPTRELALQSAEAITDMAARSRGLEVVAVYGGAPYGPQIGALKGGAQVVVGTPGRVIDLIDKGALQLDDVRYFVLDEADEMLRMGFAEDVETIAESLPTDRRTALFSATMPPAIQAVARQHLHEPVQVEVSRPASTVATVHQTYAVVPFRHKIRAVSRVLAVTDAEAAIVFVRTKSTAEDVAIELAGRGIQAAAISGDVPQRERERLVAGVAAQYESEVVYHQIRGDLEEQGVIFVDTDTAVREYPELVKEYFGTVVPAGDNKFAALNTAVWSGGSFIYVPKGVHVEIPLQAYFRINTENMGQFERTLIIADEDSYVHYVEGCTAPIYSTDSLHSAIVEIVVKKNARVRYTTIQNWSNNVYNLVTQRATCEEGATMEWIDGNIGSKRNMKYPAVFLMGPHARGEALSIAFAGEDQHQDTGAKMVHMAPHTSSHIVSKSIARHGGRSAYRGLVQIMKNARHSKSNVLCDALLVDEISRSDTYPYVDVRTDDVEMGHEATVSKVSADQLFYLMQRGLTETEAMATIVRGFVEPIARELPMEYALELNRLIELQMENSVG